MRSDSTKIVIRNPNLRRAITQLANHRGCSRTAMAEDLLWLALSVKRRKKER